MGALESQSCAASSSAAVEFQAILVKGAARTYIDRIDNGA
jgi:hypothetical protein